MTTTDEQVQERMRWLVAEIDRHDRLYYVEAKPGEFDILRIGAAFSSSI